MFFSSFNLVLFLVYLILKKDDWRTVVEFEHAFYAPLRRWEGILLCTCW